MTPPSKICNAKPLRIGGTPKDRKQAKGVTKAVTPFAVGEQLQSSARDEVLMERGNVQYAGHSCVRGVWVRRAHIRECPDWKCALPDILELLNDCFYHNRQTIACLCSIFYISTTRPEFLCRSISRYIALCYFVALQAVFNKCNQILPQPRGAIRRNQANL